MREGVTRRHVLKTALAAPLATAFGHATARAAGGQPSVAGRVFGRAFLQSAPWRIELEDGPIPGVGLDRNWNSDTCQTQIVNRSTRTVRVKQAVIFDLRPGFPPETTLYGEGFQMLSQTGGTLGQPADYSQYTDEKHYRIPAAGRALYGMMMLTPPGEATHLLAFTSCARFMGRFEIEGDALRVVVDTEGAELVPGARLPLEAFMSTSGPDASTMLEGLAAELARHHTPLKFSAPPAGWCSWYCFGAQVTAKQVLDNLDVIAKNLPDLKYIQIDDGYQPAMGDWLETGAAFGGDVKTVLADIRRRGFEPAIWVAPFIAEEHSHVFQQHRDWFVKDQAGQPLRADRVTFGGWRHGPWYVLDGTHPEAQRHLEQVFRTMRRDWGCAYFKLDATFWGAIHGGRFNDPRATRVEAYQRGMTAVRDGAGDAFILGCNHPIWPSVGFIHGSRSSNDIKRTWERVSTTARQNLSRNWQNGRLWWNDPDAVCLSDLSDDEMMFHATAIYASGGLVLSGDDLTSVPPARAAILRKLLPPTGIAAQFENDKLEVGRIVLPDRRMFCLFNWGETPRQVQVPLRATEVASDFWSAAVLARQGVVSVTVRPHSARLLELAHV
jgi:alpha-galactosidase